MEASRFGHCIQAEPPEGRLNPGAVSSGCPFNGVQHAAAHHQAVERQHVG